MLRLWAATVEYWRDMSISPTILAQAAESTRKIRNSARFMLGNIGDAELRAKMKRVERAELGLVCQSVLFSNRRVYHGYDRLNVMSCMNCGPWNKPHWTAMRPLIFRKVCAIGL